VLILTGALSICKIVCKINVRALHTLSNCIRAIPPKLPIPLTGSGPPPNTWLLNLMVCIVMQCDKNISKETV